MQKKELSISDLRSGFGFDKTNSSWIVCVTKSKKICLFQNDKAGMKKAQKIIIDGGKEVGICSGVSGKEALYAAKKKLGVIK